MDLFGPCSDYRPVDPDLPLERCCTTCSRLDECPPCSLIVERNRALEATVEAMEVGELGGSDVLTSSSE